MGPFGFHIANGSEVLSLCFSSQKFSSRTTTVNIEKLL